MAGLTTITGTGSQTSTQSPQASASGDTSGALTSSVQPGTATSLLNGQSGLALRSTALSTVSLGTSQSVTRSSRPAPAQQHHVNGALVGLAIGLVIVALISTWLFSRQVKTTTI